MRNPMYYSKLALLIFILVFLSNSSFAKQEVETVVKEVNWKMKIDKHGIKVQTFTKDGSKFLTFKGQGEVNASIDALVYLMRDVDNMSGWLHTGYDIRILDEIDAATRLIYLKNEVPVLRDRDLIITQRFIRISDELVVVELISKADAIEKNPKLVRVPEFTGSWIFRKIDPNTTHVTYTGMGDPGGLIPAALSNFMVPDAPYQSIKKIRKQPLVNYSGSLEFLATIDDAELEETRSLVN